jgi:hypothetical protein
MKINDIVKLYENEYPGFELDLTSANRYIITHDYVKAADKFKLIGRQLLKMKLYAFAAE